MMYLKAVEWYWLSLFIVLHKVVIIDKSLWMKPLGCDHETKAIEQFFHAVLFIMLYMVILTSN